MPPTDYVTYSPQRVSDMSDQLLAEELANDRRSPYVRQLTQRLIALENENARLSVKNQAYLNDLRAMDTKIDRSAFDAQVAHMDSQIKLLEQHNAQLQDQLTQVQGQLRARAEQGNSANAAVAAELGDARRKVAALEGEINGLRSRAGDSENLAGMLRQRDDEIARMRSRTEQLERDAVGMQGQLRNREMELGQFGQSKEQLMRDLNLARRHVEQRSNELNNANRRIAQLEADKAGVTTWWKEKNQGCMGSKEEAPWRTHTPQPAAIPPLPPLEGMSGMSVSRSVPHPSQSIPSGGMSVNRAPNSISLASSPDRRGTPAPYIGMVVKQNPGSNVVHLASVDPGAPASQAGLMVNDQLVSFGGATTNTIGQFRTALKANARAGNRIPVVLAADMGRQPQRSTTITVGTKMRHVPTQLPPMRTPEDLDAIVNDRARLQAVAMSAFNTCDADGSGVISKPELTTGLRRMLPPEMSRNITDAQILEAFDKGDTDASGFLVGGEFVPVMEHLFRITAQNARHVDTRGKPWIGMAVKGDRARNLVFAKDVVEGGPADRATPTNIRDNDVLVSFGGMATPTQTAFREAVRLHGSVPGRSVPVVIMRGGSNVETRVNLVVGQKQKEVIPDLPPIRTVDDLNVIVNNRTLMGKVSQAAFGAVDDDLSGLATRQEVQSGLRAWLTPSLAGMLTDQELMRLFDRADVDGSNFLVKSEFTPFLESVFREIINKRR